MTSPLRIIPASQLTLEDLADLTTRGYEDYVVPLEITTTSLARFVQSDSVDLSRSLVAIEGDAPVGVCLCSFRGRRMRVSAMGVVKQRRGQGVGARLLDEALRIAKDAGAARAQLEVIAANEGARRLYERHGFQVVRTLIGVQGEYNGAAAEPPERAELSETDPWSAIARRRIETPTPPTWQLEPHAPFSGDAYRAYTLGPAVCVVMLDDEHNHIRVITTDPDHTGRGWATALLCRVMAKHPGKPWRIIAILPEEWGVGLYRRVGMERVTFIEQREMARPL